MIKVNGFNVKFSPINNYVTTPMFKGSELSEKSEKTNIEKLPDVVPDYNIKKPISYTKTDEVTLPHGLKAHCYKLANGQSVVIVPKDGPTVIKTFVRTGSLNETDNIRGISHFLEHNFFNGSEGLEPGEFFKKVDAMGAYTNAATGMAETNYFIKSNLLNEEDLAEQIKIHASMLQSPKFLPEMLEKEKQIVNSEINMITSDPENVAMNTVLRNLYGIESTSSDLIGGTTDNITNLTREDVLNYFNQNYYPANMTTVITGDINEKEVIELVAKNFNSMKKVPEKRYYEKLTPTQMPIRQDIISPKTKATYIFTAFNGPSAANIEDKTKILALSMLLANLKSSRLDERLKEYGTSFSVAEEKISSKPDGEIANLFICKTSEQNSEKALRILFEEIENLKNNPPTEKEMEIVKKQMLLTFSQVFEYSTEVNDIIGDALSNGSFREITEFEKNVKKLTAEDISSVARKYLDLNKVSVIVMHPSTATEKSINENYENAKSLPFGSAKSVIKKNNLNQYILPNNMNIVTNDVQNDRCTMAVSFNVPPKFLTVENVGAAMILSRLFTQGTMYANKKTFDDKLQKSGIILNVSGVPNIMFDTQFDVNDFDETFMALKEIYYNPRLNEKEFNREKNNLIELLKGRKMTAFDLTKMSLFPGEIESLSPTVLIKELENTTFEDVKSWYTQLRENVSGSVAISAPFKANPELKNNLFVKFNEFDNLKPYELKIKENYKDNLETKVLTLPEESNQAKIMETYTFKNTYNVKDNTTLELMNDILGGGSSSRLFTDLRENRKLAYAVQSELKSIGNTAMVNLFIKTTTDNKETGEISYDNLQKVIDGFNENVERMINEKVTEEELNNAKLSLKNSILFSNETSRAKTYNIFDGVLYTYYGPDYLNQKFNIIDEITVDDIQKAARYAFANKPIYAITATKDTIEYNKDYLKKLELKSDKC